MARSTVTVLDSVGNILDMSWTWIGKDMDMSLDMACACMDRVHAQNMRTHELSNSCVPSMLHFWHQLHVAVFNFHNSSHYCNVTGTSWVKKSCLPLAIIHVD